VLPPHGHKGAPEAKAIFTAFISPHVAKDRKKVSLLCTSTNKGKTYNYSHMNKLKKRDTNGGWRDFEGGERKRNKQTGRQKREERVEEDGDEEAAVGEGGTMAGAGVTVTAATVERRRVQGEMDTAWGGGGERREEDTERETKRRMESGTRGTGRRRVKKERGKKGREIDSSRVIGWLPAVGV